jgi:hypothetical protein
MVAGLVLNQILWMLTARSVLSLDQSEFTIEHRYLGRTIRNNTLKRSTSRLGHLRFVSASNREETRNTYRQSEMQIDEDLKTHPFAEGITEVEILALIGKMMEIYSFPK